MNFNNIFGKIIPSYRDKIKEIPINIIYNSKYFLFTFLKLIFFPLNNDKIKLPDIDKENNNIILYIIVYIKPVGKKYRVEAL